MTFFRLCLALSISLLFFLPGCERTPSLGPLPADPVVLAFGDSLTRGTGAGDGEGYPAVLERLLGWKVVNAGVPGELSRQGLARLPEVLAEVRPDLVILCHGGNDLLQRRTPEEIAANLREMGGLIRNAGAQVVFVGVPQPGLLLKPAPFYEEVADTLQAPIESDALAQILSRGSMKSDYIHPNAEGYALLAEALAELIQKAQR